MPHRIIQRRVGRTRRRTLVGRVLGASPDSSIDSLKQYLHSATLTDSPTEKLDLVVLESYEHFAELLANGGIPLAREDASEALFDRVPRVIKFELRIGPAILAGAVILGMFLDDLIAAVTGLNLIPWF